MERVMEPLFGSSGVLVLPFWALMMLAPRWRVTERIVRSPLIVLGPALLYAALVLPGIAGILPHMMRPELAAISALLGTPQGTTISWAHFLAFDLFVGRWIYLDARERQVSAWIVTPLLFLTLLLGPLGLVGYLAARGGWAQRLAQASRGLLGAARRGSPALLLLGAGSGALLVASLAFSMVDPRDVTGVSTWVKPAKFAASILVTAPVLGAIMSLLPPSRGMRRAASIVAITITLELVLITMQAARAVPSHFNFTTRFDALVFQTMAVAITMFWATQMWLTWRAFRQPFANHALGAGIRMGLLVSTLGAGLGFTMPSRPTPAQIAAVQDGRPTLLGAHAVGVPDGGDGLPVTGWSTDGGDLRVPHFLGLHALQGLPLVGWALSRRLRANQAAAASLTVAIGVAWAGLVVTTLVQALRAEPLLAPGAGTVALALTTVAAPLLFGALQRKISVNGRPLRSSRPSLPSSLMP